MTIPDERNQNELESMNETMSFSMRNISNNLKSEIDDLRETIIKEVGLQLANLTDELNAMKQKQNEVIDLGNEHDQKLDDLWLHFLVEMNMTLPVMQQYINYASSLNDTSDAPQMIRKSLAAINPSEINEFKRLVTDRIPDALSLKLHPIDGNLKKVRDSKWI